MVKLNVDCCSVTAQDNEPRVTFTTHKFLSTQEEMPIVVVVREHIPLSAAMQLYRNTKGGYAVMILECDDRIPPDMVRWLSGLDGILKITSYNAEEDV